MDATGMRILARMYRTDVKLSVDQLPYTKEFDQFYKRFRDATGKELTKNEFYRALTNLRKRGDLVRKGRQLRV